MGFAPQASIDHAALRHNLQQVRTKAPNSRIWAVIKADAYGHGIKSVAKGLAAADGFAVARVEEALRLRQLGIHKPLLILGGVFSPVDAQAAIHAECQLAVHHPYQVELLQELNVERSVAVWLKVDTGMHRLGVRSKQLNELADRLRHCPSVSEVNLMTHLANADDRSDPTTRRQCERFEQLPLTTFKQLSMANSAGLMAYPSTQRDWVRPGIMLYGVSPFGDSIGEQEGLRPVMTFSARVMAVSACQKGDPVGYGGSYRCPADMPVAVVGVGYGDGYPRHAASGTPVLIRQQRLPLVGRVSMDMLCVDARAVPDLTLGEQVILWGNGLPVEEIARAADTIGYELLCSITGRVEFIDQHVAHANIG
ncbi:MAG: alanine racemase [Pseudomonadota bacterium]